MQVLAPISELRASEAQSGRARQVSNDDLRQAIGTLDQSAKSTNWFAPDRRMAPHFAIYFSVIRTVVAGYCCLGFSKTSATYDAIQPPGANNWHS